MIKRFAIVAALAVSLLAETGAWQKAAFTSQTTTVQTVKNAPGTFGGYYVSNAANTSSSCLQIFDTAGAVTLGTTTPSLVYEIPGSSAANIEFSQGVQMASGIKFAIATTCTGSTAPGSGLNLTLYYR